mgnify:CR=1 FL=1
MDKIQKVNFNDGFQMGDWGVSCNGRTFKVNNNGMKLAARKDEELRRITFDVNNKVVSIDVKNPIVEKAPRTVNLSKAPEFFNELRKDIVHVLTNIGSFEVVSSNENNTIFEII